MCPCRALPFWSSFCLYAFLFAFTAQAQHQFYIDFTQVSNDQVTVKCTVNKPYRDSVNFHFPMTIPGTYETLDYGKYITDFLPLNQQAQPLKFKKIGHNSYRIYGAENLRELSYKVHDTFDTLVKENKIFEPAGTNIEAGKNFLVNGGGWIGFFEGEEGAPFSLTITVPDSMDAFTAYPKEVLPSKKDKIQRFQYRNYHEWIDHPIMIGVPDTAEFWIHQTKVVIACYHEKGIKVASATKKQLEKSLSAIANFLPKLPVNQYVFLLYLKNFEEELAILNSKGKLWKKIRLAFKLSGLGFGALEHGTSSVYYLLDGGNLEFLKDLQSVAIHEFLHILTPLSLHTEPIGNFNYIQPKFSKHLWLYEGSTEYHAGIVQIQNQLLSFEEYFEKYVEDKLENAKSFPINKMSFAEMSEKVIEPKYQRQYLQVYELGALLCMALDIEIIHLTQGKKTLKSVILELLQEYGRDKNVPEEQLISEIVKRVHPDLQKFFDQHILGKVYPNFEEYLEKVGIFYGRGSYPFIPVVIKNGEIVKVKSTAYKMFQKGDKVSRQAINEACYDKKGNLLPDGTRVQVEVIRKGQKQQVSFPVQTRKDTYSFQINPKATESQTQLRKIWIGI